MTFHQHGLLTTNREIFINDFFLKDGISVGAGETVDLKGFTYIINMPT